MRKFGSLFLISLISGATTLGGYKLFIENASADSKLSIAPDNITRTVGFGAENIDFTASAEKAVHTVVHVKNKTVYKVPTDPFMELMFGYRGNQEQTQVGTGSGVIISKDGYIVTNNHVIQNATELEVTLNNNKTYKAKLIGTDSKMDIALLKIDADEDLPAATFGNSDQIKVGEWVLAVGNPYNLTSTVTAGIVSAKARDLSNQGIQSFIQTDAAVNPGNSGGALVNTRGELIGINTMISSPTGSYAGYSFAVPSNLARKIVEDLMEFGNVQRGVLGIEGRELNTAAAKEINTDETSGVYVAKVSKGTGAEKAGLKSGDIIKKLDDKSINSFADLTAYINTKRPNDDVKVGFIRDGKLLSVPVKLVKKELVSFDLNGIELEDLDLEDKKTFGINYGVKITEINNQRLNDYYSELKDNIILSINNIKIEDISTLKKINLSNKELIKVKLINKKGIISNYLFDLRN